MNEETAARYVEDVVRRLSREQVPVPATIELHIAAWEYRALDLLGDHYLMAAILSAAPHLAGRRIRFVHSKPTPSTSAVISRTV